MRENERFASPDEFRQKIGELFPKNYLIPGKRLASLFRFPGFEKISPDELNGLVLTVLQKLTTVSFEDQSEPKIRMDKKQQGLFYYYFGLYPELDGSTREITALHPHSSHDYLSFEKAAEKVELNPFLLREEQRKLTRSLLIIISRYSLLDTSIKERVLDFDTLSNGYLMVNTESGFSVSFQPEEIKIIKEKEVISPQALRNHSWRTVYSLMKEQKVLRGRRGVNIKPTFSFLKNQGIRVAEYSSANGGTYHMIAPEDIEKAKSLLRSVMVRQNQQG